jgi:hypothetical protein
MPTPPKLQPALFGGLFMGVLSALPLISAGNCVCCMWVIGGGMLAVYVMQQNHPYPITAADGALVGVLAGLVGGVIGTIVSIPVDIMMGPIQRQLMERIISNPDFPAESRTMIESMTAAASGPTVAGTLVKLVMFEVVGVVFGMFGGLLGVSLFKKKDLPPPGTIEVLPPPPGSGL